MKVRSFRELKVWQKAMDLVELIYRVSAGFPREEMYGLSIQMRRAAVSVPSNIAEGQGRRTTRDFLNFLSIAHGSLRELETQITIAERLKYLSPERTSPLYDLASEVGRLLNGLTRALDDR